MPEPNAGGEELRLAILVDGMPDLRAISSRSTLKTIIQDICESHSKPNPDDYALIYKNEKVKEYKIVTEKNRGDLHGSIVELGESPARSTTRILQEINSCAPDTTALSKALKDLQRMSVDSTFALEFFTKKGLSVLMTGISNGKFRGNEVGFVLGSIQGLMDNDIVTVDETVADQTFVAQIASFCNTPNHAAATVRPALAILSSLVQDAAGNERGEMVERELNLPSLVSLLCNNNVQLQLNALTLINHLLQFATPIRRPDMVRMLAEKPARTLILEHVLEGAGMKQGESSIELGHQLYLMQLHMLNQLQERLRTKIEPQDSMALNKIKELRSTAFETGSPSVGKNNTRFAQDYKKLGFNNEKDPTLDFACTPPGILALDCMHYFAVTHGEKFTKVVLENSCRNDNHECPFATSSIELVKLLVTVLSIGKPPSPHSANYQEMFFKHDHPFEEFFCQCIVLLNKTWREMRATREDFQKVLDVVKEQIESSLNHRPKTFDMFRSSLKSYSEISRRWQSDAKSREAWARSAPVQQLRNHLTPEIQDIIRQQRQNFLVEGTKFHRYKRSGEQEKQRYRYVKLHNNHKTLYVGDWNHDKLTPTIEDLEPKLQIVDIKDIVTGVECPHVKEFRNKEKNEYKDLAFSLIAENGTLDCVAPDEMTFNYWVDGVNTLLRRDMNSNDYEKEKKMLLDMEIKLRLLDLEGIDLPEEAPEVPSPPQDFNFASC